jgi:hypothetical protein
VVNKQSQRTKEEAKKGGQQTTEVDRTNTEIRNKPRRWSKQTQAGEEGESREGWKASANNKNREQQEKR